MDSTTSSETQTRQKNRLILGAKAGLTFHAMTLRLKLDQHG